MPTHEQITPQSLDAEQSTLGAMLMEHDAAARAIELLRGEDFYREIHRKIFRAMREIFAANEPVDLITVIHELQRRDHHDEVGGAAYLAALIEACPSSANVDSYIRVVRDKSLRRQVIAAADSAKADAFQSEKRADEVLNAAGRRFFALGQDRTEGGFVQVMAPTDAVFAGLEAKRDQPGPITGIATGFHDYDAITGGLHPRQLTVLAARPGMGKSSLGMQMGGNVSTSGMAFGGTHHAPMPVAVFSLEMSKEDLLTRLIAQVAGVNGQQLARGWVGDKEWEYVRSARLLIRKAPIYIDDERGMTTFKMMVRLRRLAGEVGPLGLIITDYLQLARAEGKTENRVQEMSEIARHLREMAMQFNCPMLALAQLSRAVEQRDDKRPILSDLKESGGIEEAADTVAFIYRPGYYSRDREDARAEIIVAKQRYGPTGTVNLYFNGEKSRFENAAGGDGLHG